MMQDHVMVEYHNGEYTGGRRLWVTPGIPRESRLGWVGIVFNSSFTTKAKKVRSSLVVNIKGLEL